MPARRFFAILKASREIESRERNLFLADLCDVAAVPLCNAEFQDNLKRHFIARATGGTWRRGTSVQLDHKDPRGPQILASIVKQKARLEGLGG